MTVLQFWYRRQNSSKHVKSSLADTRCVRSSWSEKQQASTRCCPTSTMDLPRQIKVKDKLLEMDFNGDIWDKIVPCLRNCGLFTVDLDLVPRWKGSSLTFTFFDGMFLIVSIKYYINTVAVVLAKRVCDRLEVIVCHISEQVAPAVFIDPRPFHKTRMESLFCSKWS